MIWGVFISAQLPLETLERANLALEGKNYQEAIQSYEEYLDLTGNRSMVALQLAQAYYMKGYYGSASEELFFLREQSSSPPPDIYWWEARILHAQNRFDVAAKLYKKYWPYASRSGKEQVEQALLHCETGEKIHVKGQVAFVQNMGHEVNGTSDEWAPFSMVYNGSRGLAFSSDRIDKEGESLSSQAKFRPFFLEVHAEQPREISMPVSDKDIIMYHAWPKRKEAVLFSGEHWPYGQLHSVPLTEESLSPDFEREFTPPPNAKFGDTDVFFTEEGCILFSAVMEGTKGGYDIYKTCPQSNSWSEPQPISGKINGPWHERSPSLHRNGKILFFSSDRPEGLGGFDVFYSVKKGGSWSSPTNLGLGVNSLKDELFFRWGEDEYSAYFISDRPESIGGFDIYQAYFKEPIVSEESLIAYAEHMRADEGTGPEQVLLKPLFFKSLEEELSSSNTNYLHELSEYLTGQPDLDIQIICRSRYKGPKKYDLLFSLKKANQVADYLNEKGIAAERIHLTGAGAGTSEAVTKGKSDFQYRVDFLLSDISEYEEQSSPISSSDMNQLLHESDFFYLAADKLLSGLTYSVQVAALERLYESDVLEEFQWPMVRVRYGREVNHYTLGLFTTYREAKNLRRRLLASGHIGAFIVANIDGIRKTRGELHPLKHKFKDLTSYIYVD
jgi:outer membrane protein OmpA-like peptidoglycan-associated protein